MEKGDETYKLVEIDLPDDEIFQNVQEVINHDDIVSEVLTENEASLRRSNREKQQPEYYGDWVNATRMTEQYHEPTTFEASTSPEKKQMDGSYGERDGLSKPIMCTTW